MMLGDKGPCALPRRVQAQCPGPRPREGACRQEPRAVTHGLWLNIAQREDTGSESLLSVETLGLGQKASTSGDSIVLKVNFYHSLGQ